MTVVAICFLTTLPVRGTAQAIPGNSRIEPDTIEIVLPDGISDTAIVLPATMFKTELEQDSIISASHNAPARFSEGTTTVTWTIKYNDASGPGQEFELSQTVIVKFSPCGTDGEGNMFYAVMGTEKYATVRIGSDCWLAENLRNTCYADGTPIPQNNYYNNDSALLAEFGRLYAWSSAVRADASGNPMLTDDGAVQGACPVGWSIPSANDYLRLVDMAGGIENLKCDDPHYWLGKYGGTTPGTGFDALPGGYYTPVGHTWRELLGECYFWTSGSTHDYRATGCEFGYHCKELIINNIDKLLGYSLRCIRQHPALRGDIAVIACDSFVWHGTTYNVTGDYEQTYTGAKGFKHIDSLHLTVNYSSVPAEFTATACESYEWAGETYTKSCDTTRHFTNAAGCDSAVTLHLTINPVYALEECKVISKVELPCIWRGMSCDSAGIWYDSLTTAAGCDSVFILTLKVNPDSNLSFTVNGVSFEMKFVEEGAFTMGCTSEQRNDCNDDERLIHEVTLSSYYMGETEVTQALWKAVMGSWPDPDPDRQPGSTFGVGDDYPAYFVSWKDIKRKNGFIDKLNDLLSSQLSGRHFDLPTEAQWEFAARGGNYDCPNKYAGSNIAWDVAWYNGNGEGRTHPVKGKSPNELGLYDMSGNIWEWCSDWYGGYETEVQTDPDGPGSGKHCVLRGGSWNNRAFSCRVSDRGSAYPVSRHSQSGFRLVLLP